jgi:hypothetical protein
MRIIRPNEPMIFSETLDEHTQQTLGGPDGEIKPVKIFDRPSLWSEFESIVIPLSLVNRIKPSKRCGTWVDPPSMKQKRSFGKASKTPPNIRLARASEFSIAFPNALQKPYPRVA